MKNITLSAEESLIERAREVSRRRNSSLNAMFREWLAALAEENSRLERLKALNARLSYVRSGGKFSREEMNGR